jgi:hypothetical protein
MRLWVLLSVVSLPLATVSAEDSLREAKKELHGPKPSSSGSGSTSSKPSSSSSSSVSHYQDDDDDDSFGGALFGFVFEGLGELVYATFLWPSDTSLIVGALAHPYAETTPSAENPAASLTYAGYYAPVGHAQPGRIFSGDLSAEGGWIDDDLQRYSLGGRLNISAFVLRTEWSRYVEERADGGHETLNLGTIDAELGVTFGTYGRLGLGLGATITHDSISTEAGPCVALALDVFPLQPVILSGALTYAKVGDYDTEIFTWRATLGGIWKRYELYGGWQSTSIGSVELDGPTAGLRVWF